MKKVFKLVIISFICVLDSCAQTKKDATSYDVCSSKVYIIQPTQWQDYNQQQGEIKVVVIVDVFRACTTASYILHNIPKTYIIAEKSSVIERLANKLQSPLLIGKAEKGVNLIYNIPNSPTRVQDVTVTNKSVLHRTAAGAKGILFANQSDIVLVAGFVNACATARYIKKLANTKVIIIPMGHEGVCPSLEDDLCAAYIKALIEEKPFRLPNLTLALQEGPGKYFFSEDQFQYPREDFFRCIETDRFDFIIKATIVDDYAILTRSN